MKVNEICRSYSTLLSAILGNYIVSLGNVCKWLGDQATDLGVEIYPATPASEARLSLCASQQRSNALSFRYYLRMTAVCADLQQLTEV